MVSKQFKVLQPIVSSKKLQINGEKMSIKTFFFAKKGKKIKRIN